MKNFAYVVFCGVILKRQRIKAEANVARRLRSRFVLKGALPVEVAFR